MLYRYPQCGHRYPDAGWYVLAVLSVIMLGLFSTVRTNQHCTSKAYEQPGDIMFTMITSMRENDGQGSCGDVSYEALQSMMAVKYVIEKLNRPASQTGEKFIPGVNIGFEVFDDCGNVEYATSHAITIMRRSFPREITQCSAESTSPVYTGVIGSSRSSTTSAIATLLRNTDIPIVSNGATLSELSNKTSYPNLMRTVLSDKKQIEAMLLLAKNLSWTMLAIIHTDDNYGTTGARELKALAKQHRICVTLTEAISNSNRTARGIVRVLDRLLEQQQNTISDRLGVIYIGQREAGRSIFQQANSLIETDLNTYSPIKDLQWIMSDSIGTNSDVFQQLPQLSDVIVSFSPMSTKLTEFGIYFQNEIKAAAEGSNQTVQNKWLKEYVAKKCSVVPQHPTCSVFDQNDYVGATVDAVYTLSASAKQVHQKVCQGRYGICDEWRTAHLDLQNTTRSIHVNYANLHQNHTPPEFQLSSRQIRFDDNGDIVYQPLDNLLYHINVFTGTTFKSVGNYSGRGVNVDVDQLRSTSPRYDSSMCKTVCEECLDIQPFIYIPGEVLIAAFFSIHEAPSENDNPFDCGDFRKSTNVIPSLEAFLYTFKKLKSSTAGRFGLIVFDDCYNSLKAEEIITSYFSGKIPLIDKITGEIIDPQKIVAVIGAEPSGVSVPLATATTRLQLPQISYASSTPDLDDRTLFPYFLRTVPSDEVQARAMVEIVEKMEWKYINIVYTNNNYGLKGMLKIKEFATGLSICVAEPIKISETPEQNELNEITKKLDKQEAQVVVYFGIKEGLLRLLKTLMSHKIDSFTFIASEDLGINVHDLRVAGVDNEAAGLLVVTLDTSNTEQTSFADYLRSKTPSHDDINPWFTRFWQDHFGCNIPSSFEKKYDKNCDPGRRLNIDINDQRILHTMNALVAVVKGLWSAHDFLCHLGEQAFACKKYQLHPNLVIDKIRNVTLLDQKQEVKFKPFRENGNGNIGFVLSNLQRTDDGTFEYIQVGRYDTQGLQLRRDTIRFYDSDRKVTKRIESVCTTDTSCSECKGLVGGEKNETGSAANDGGDRLLAVLVVVCVICLLVLVVLIVLVCFIIKQNKDRDKYYTYKRTIEDSANSASTNGTIPTLRIQNTGCTYNSPALTHVSDLADEGSSSCAVGPRNDSVRTQGSFASPSVRAYPNMNRPAVALPQNHVTHPPSRERLGGLPLPGMQQRQAEAIVFPVSLSTSSAEPQGLSSLPICPDRISAISTHMPDHQNSSPLPMSVNRPAHRCSPTLHPGETVASHPPVYPASQPVPKPIHPAVDRIKTASTGSLLPNGPRKIEFQNGAVPHFYSGDHQVGLVFCNPTSDTICDDRLHTLSADNCPIDNQGGYTDMSGIRDTYLTAQDLPNNAVPDTPVTDV